MDLSSIFKAYDVRGLAPEQIDAAVAERIGAAFARFARGDEIAVGWDCRASSPKIADGLVAGIVSQATSVVRLGHVTTDMVYFASGQRSLPAVMVTASHNPPEYNGLKFCRSGAAPVGQETGLEQIRRDAEAGVAPAGDRGAVRDDDITGAYVRHVLDVVGAGSIGSLRVAVDGGNGMAGVAVPAVFAELAAELEGLYLEPDGSFPNHPADPLRPENLVDLLALVAETEADLGVAFDGDADRAFFVDEHGVPLPGSTTTAIIAEWFLRSDPGATIVHNLICSRAVPETIRAAGGVPVRTRVGHSFIKQVMKETGAVFGGEHSGHYYFRDHYRADSGILAMLVLMRVMSDDGRPLSELRRGYEPYAQSGEINIAVDDQAAAIERVETTFRDAPSDRVDGLTMELPDGAWFNLRPSNTEPLLRLNVEADDRHRVDRVVAEVRAIIEEV